MKHDPSSDAALPPVPSCAPQAPLAGTGKPSLPVNDFDRSKRPRGTGQESLPKGEERKENLIPASEIPLWQVRDWTPDDHPMISEWRKTRGALEFPPALVPPNAVIVTRDGAALAYAALFITVPREHGGASLGWCEFFTTAPGLAFSDTRKCASLVLDFFRAVARDSGVSTLIAFGDQCSTRVLRNLGMHDCGGTFSFLIEPLN